MIRVTLRQLEYFVAAARHGGAARAAESLNVSQPSISKAIADLARIFHACSQRRAQRGIAARI